MFEGGYISIVVSIIQSVAEYHFFMPDDMQIKMWHQRVEAFKEFWDSGMPILGEARSKGFCLIFFFMFIILFRLEKQQI